MAGGAKTASNKSVSFASHRKRTALIERHFSFGLSFHTDLPTKGSRRIVPITARVALTDFRVRTDGSKETKYTALLFYVG